VLTVLAASIIAVGHAFARTPTHAGTAAAIEEGETGHSWCNQRANM